MSRQLTKKEDVVISVSVEVEDLEAQKGLLECDHNSEGSG